MVDFRGMLEGLDNPREVSGVGVGTCAGDILIEREANAMCRDGGIKDGKTKPLPVSIFTCPEPWSDDESFEGSPSGPVNGPEVRPFLWDGNGHAQTNPGSLYSMRC